MKVAQLIDSLDAGGAERMAVTIANALANQGVESYLIVSRKEGLLKSTISPKVKYLFLNKQGPADFKTLFKLHKYVKHQKINLLHAHSSSFFWASLCKIRIPKLKLYWHDHYGDSEHLANRPHKMLKMCSRLFDGAIVVNDLLYTWNKEVLGLRNVFFMKNFVPAQIALRGVTKLSGTQGKRIVMLANLRPQKNHLFLLEAFSEVIKNDEEWTLHFVGKNFKDECAEHVEEFISSHKLKEHVFLYGSCLDVSYILSQATIGVLSSVSEGLPLALLEYGIAGLPVITTAVGQCATVVQEEGIVVPVAKKEAYVNALRLLMKNSELREKLAKAYQQRIQKEYSETSRITALLDWYAR